MAQVRIKEEKILSDEHYVLKRIDYDIQKKGGEWRSERREVFNAGNAVVALLYNPEEKTVILVRQFRMPTYLNGNSNGLLTEAPAGLLDRDEAPEEAIVREIKEETGYQVASVQKIYEAYTSPGSLTEAMHFYLARYSREQQLSEGGGLQEEGEELTVMEMPFSQAVQMMEKGEIKDVKTIVLLQYALLKNLIS